MNIKTQFDIGDVVEGKFIKGHSKSFVEFIVTELQTVSCSAGTQEIYHCRPYSTVSTNLDFMKNWLTAVEKKGDEDREAREPSGEVLKLHGWELRKTKHPNVLKAK